MDVKTDYEKRRDEFVFKRDFLKSILMVASEESQRIPAEYQYVLGELVWGTVDYLGGKSCGVGYKNNLDNSALHNGLWKILNGHLQIFRWKVDEKIFNALRGLVEPHTHHAPPDRPYFSCELHDCYDSAEGIIRIRTHSIAPLPTDWKISVEFTENQKKDMGGIGNAMRPYLKEDLEHISKTYRW